MLVELTEDVFRSMNDHNYTKGSIVNVHEFKEFPYSYGVYCTNGSLDWIPKESVKIAEHK